MRAPFSFLTHTHIHTHLMLVVLVSPLYPLFLLLSSAPSCPEMHYKSTIIHYLYAHMVKNLHHSVY